jgi:GNAT superfamily N-acetyltransferase
LHQDALVIRSAAPSEAASLSDLALRLSASELELEALFVEPGRIGQGIGRALIEHAKFTAAQVGASSLLIQGDPHAERFYRAAGGRLVGRRESASIPGRFLPVFVIPLKDPVVA